MDSSQLNSVGLWPQEWGPTVMPHFQSTADTGSESRVKWCLTRPIQWLYWIPADVHHESRVNVSL